MQLLQLGFVFLMGGVALTLIGKSEYENSQKAAVDPVPVKLPNLEAGKPVPNLHLQIGGHYPIYSSSLGRYKKNVLDLRDVDENTPMDWVYYPIVSDSHPYIREWRKLQKKFGDQPIPPELTPRLKQFTVLVRSFNYDKLADLPPDDDYAESIRGMVVNDLYPLDPSIKDLVQQSFPDLDMSKVILFDFEREPTTRAAYILKLLIGSAMSTVGFIMLVKQGSRYLRPRRPTAPRYYVDRQTRELNVSETP